MMCCFHAEVKLKHFALLKIRDSSLEKKKNRSQEVNCLQVIFPSHTLPPLQLAHHIYENFGFLFKVDRPEPLSLSRSSRL